MPTDVEIAAIRVKIAQAKDALHKLMTGRQATTLGYDGETVTYTAANEGALRRYIAELETSIGDRARARRPGVRV